MICASHHIQYMFMAHRPPASFEAHLRKPHKYVMRSESYLGIADTLRHF